MVDVPFVDTELPAPASDAGVDRGPLHPTTRRQQSSTVGREIMSDAWLVHEGQKPRGQHGKHPDHQINDLGDHE